MEEQRVVLLRAAPQGGVPPELRLDPGQDLDGVEGLGDIVVRPDVETQHLVGVLALGGEQDDGDICALPQLGGGPDAVQARHHHVHEDQVDVVLLHQLQGLQTVVGVVGLVALAGEVDVQGGDDIPVVVADENVIQRAHSLCGIITTEF